ncbi:nucleotidyltransferase family protein [Neobacillus sp. PS3-12]|uniref:nucleotidyltransferase domain-containing protein n=1 Tax=Neobacillus sp. PS3-12 TaxID=3070677 RepID=UPI0027DF7625|nr:nucleotidyltransferase family protein [Neobacillus sp. PS3-12]WML51579.1 nucleotidyltransferase family protein [Neobacillus sp. PS3-12]
MNNELYINLDEFPNELQLLLFILKNKMDDHSIGLCKEQYKNIDWNLFLVLVKHHRVTPLIYTKLKSINQSFIPLFIIQTLFQDYQKNIFNMLHLSGEAEILANTFSDNQIRTLFLKGPVLGSDLYGDISLRMSSDLDLLIPISDLNKAENILLSLGYIKDDYIETVLNDWKWRHHHITFFHPERKIKVEVHWRLNPGPGKEQKFNEMWDRKRVSSLTSRPVYMLGLEDLFLFLVSHGARHGWSRLRWLVDINQLINKEFDWIKSIHLLEKSQLVQIGGQASILASQLLGTNIPIEFNNLIKNKKYQQLALEAVFYIKQMVNLHTPTVPEEISDYHKRHLFSLMSMEQKVVFILSFLYPYPEDAEFLPLPKSLHLLYFPLRPFILISRKLKKRAIARRA